jgi:hypothetical protein
MIDVMYFCMYEFMTSYFLGDPPPDPRFLASLGAVVGRAPSLLHIWLKLFLFGVFSLGKKEASDEGPSGARPGGKYKAVMELYR